MCVCTHTHTHEIVPNTFKISNSMRYQSHDYKIPYYNMASLLNNLHLIVKHFYLGILGYIFAPSVTDCSTLIVSLRNMAPLGSPVAGHIYHTR